MSINGKAESKVKLRGSMSLPDMIVGMNAYEIAVMNGFVGTEEEWLESLKGDPGEPGAIPTFEVDEVETLEAGENAWVNINTGDPETPLISFGIPKGESGSLPVPTVNTEKKITESGYYVAYAVYSSITFPLGVFYYPEDSLGLYIRNGDNYLRIGYDGSVTVGTISLSVNESGNVVKTETELPWYTLYTAKL